MRSAAVVKFEVGDSEINLLQSGVRISYYHSVIFIQERSVVVRMNMLSGLTGYSPRNSFGGLRVNFVCTLVGMFGRVSLSRSGHQHVNRAKMTVMDGAQ